MRPPSAALLAACLLTVGCSSADGDGDFAASEYSVVGGVAAPFERPEVGRLGSCTATLVASNVVLSAAHCFDRKSGARSVGAFLVDRPGGEIAFPTVEVRVFGDGIAEDDLALVRLASDVPEGVARPVALASSVRRGAPVTMWGYGCTSRPIPVEPSGGGAIASGEAEDKRRLSFSWGGPSHGTCPGDSGGPVLDLGGRLVAVVSGYVALPDDVARGLDAFGDPIRRQDELRDQIVRWQR